MHCERECTGILKCDKPNLCTCELTVEQKIKLVSNTRDVLGISLAFAISFLFCLISLVYHYKIKSRRLKSELKTYSLRYSSELSKVEFSNPIYSKNLLDDSTSPATDLTETPQTKKSLLDALKTNNLFNKMNSMSKDWLKLKTGKQANTETTKNGSDQVNGEESDQTYSTISEMNEAGAGKTKSNDDPAV